MLEGLIIEFKSSLTIMGCLQSFFETMQHTNTLLYMIAPLPSTHISVGVVFFLNNRNCFAPWTDNSTDTA